MSAPPPPSPSPASPPEAPEPARGFGERVEALRRRWLVLEAARLGGWLALGLGAALALGTLVLLLPRGAAAFRPLVETLAWLLTLAAGARYVWLVSSLGPRRFVRLAERRLGRRDDVWITAFEWEHFPEACSGSPELVAVLVARARREIRAVAPTALTPVRALVAPWAAALAVWVAVGGCLFAFGPVFPAGRDARQAVPPYFRITADPPAHTGLGRIDNVSATCDADLPIGSEVYLRVLFPWPPDVVSLQEGGVSLPLLAAPEGPHAFQTSFRLDQTRSLLFFAGGRPPVPCTLRAIADQPPSVRLNVSSTDRPTFESGRLLGVEAADDYGLARVDLEVKVNGIVQVRTLLDARDGARRSFSTNAAVDTRGWEIRPGDAIEARVVAVDSAPEGETGRSQASAPLAWTVPSEAEAELLALLADEEQALGRWLDQLADALESGLAPPDVARELGDVSAIVRRFKRLFSPLGRHEQRLAAFVDQTAREPPEGAGEALAWLEQLVWLWVEAIRDHARGVLDLRREAIEGTRTRLGVLLRSATPDAAAVQAELARLSHQLEGVDVFAAGLAWLLAPGEAPSPLAEGAQGGDVQGWLARLQEGRTLASLGRWGELDRLLGELVAQQPGGLGEVVEGAPERAWTLRVRALHKRVRPIVDHQRAVVLGVEELIGDEEQALARWAAENLVDVEAELARILGRLEREISRIPIPSLIDDPINAIKRTFTLVEIVGEDWAGRRFRDLRSDLGELGEALRALRSDLYLHDLDARPVQRVLRLIERAGVLLDRIERFKGTILGERGREVLEAWHEEQQAVTRGVDSLRREVARLASAHPEIAGLGDLLARAHARASEARRSLAEHRAEPALEQARAAQDLLEKVDAASRAAAGSIPANRRLVIRVGGRVALSPGAPPARRLSEELGPFLKVRVPERWQDAAERYYRYLMEF